MKEEWYVCIMGNDQAPLLREGRPPDGEDGWIGPFENLAEAYGVADEALRQMANILRRSLAAMRRDGFTVLRARHEDQT